MLVLLLLLYKMDVALFPAVPECDDCYKQHITYLILCEIKHAFQLVPVPQSRIVELSRYVHRVKP